MYLDWKSPSNSNEDVEAFIHLPQLLAGYRDAKGNWLAKQPERDATSEASDLNQSRQIIKCSVLKWQHQHWLLINLRLSDREMCGAEDRQTGYLDLDTHLLFLRSRVSIRALLVAKRRFGLERGVLFKIIANDVDGRQSPVKPRPGVTGSQSVSQY